MAKTAILYICTGVYKALWKGFYESFQNNFLPNTEKEYFVFTDARRLDYETEACVHKFYQKDLGWPDNTLKRFDMFLSIKEELLKFDYTFFFNANIRCCRPILEEEVLPLKEGENLVMAIHAKYFDKEPDTFSYDRNPECLAYIPYGTGEYYVMGSFNGGKSAAFLQMSETLSENTKKDLEKGIIALWHDESHLNHYLIGRTDVKILPASYVASEGETYPFKADMLLLDKNKFFDVEYVKAPGIKGKIIVLLKQVRRWQIAHISLKKR